MTCFNIFPLCHHHMTKFFVPELTQKSIMIAWNDPIIISVKGEAEFCCHLGFLNDTKET